MDVVCLVEAADRLGDGACWSAAENRLYWFDVKGRRLAWYDPATTARGTFTLPMRASAAAPRAAGGLLLATERGLAVCDPDAGTVAIVRQMAFDPGFRTGDGKVDPAGNFWWTLIDDSGARPGSVYRTTPAFETTRLLTGVYQPNAISFSPDARRLYVADSKLQTIFIHKMADLSELLQFAHLRDAIGTPDGGAVDAHGFFWSAQPGASRVVRYTPDGRAVQVVPMPVRLPISCAFGGAEFTTLFVTSAAEDGSPPVREKQPLAGGLFAFETGVKGLPIPLFDG